MSQIKNDKKNHRKLFVWLIITHLYCLILSWFNGGEKLNYHPVHRYFFSFLSWWCTWNSIVTIIFSAINLRKKVERKSLFFQSFAVITAVSNIIASVIFLVGSLILITTSILANQGIVEKPSRVIPIPHHNWDNIKKVFHWWSYSPIWHVFAPFYFLKWFFYEQKKEQKLFLAKNFLSVLLLCFLHPSLYYFYCFLRKLISEKLDSEAIEKPFFDWPYWFLKSDFIKNGVLKWFQIKLNKWIAQILVIIILSIFYLTLTYYCLKFAIKQVIIKRKSSYRSEDNEDKKQLN